jgi:hypothetical protein
MKSKEEILDKHLLILFKEKGYEHNELEDTKKDLAYKVTLIAMEEYAKSIISKVVLTVPEIAIYCKHPEEFREQTSIDTEMCELCQTEL